MLRYRRKLESHLAHAHITRVRVRDAAEFAAKLAAAAGEAKTRGEEQRVDERRGRWGGERRNEGEGLGSEAANEGKLRAASTPCETASPRQTPE